MTVRHYRGRGILSQANVPVAVVQYFLEQWTMAGGTGPLLGTVTGQVGLVLTGEASAFVLRLETGTTLRCHLRALDEQGTYELIPDGELEQPVP